MTEAREQGLSGSEIVGKYTEEVKRTIAEGFGTAVAATVKVFDRKLFWWAVGLMFSMPILGGGAAWLVVSYMSDAPVTWSAQHAGPNETCVLQPNQPNDEVLFICHLTPPTGR